MKFNGIYLIGKGFSLIAQGFTYWSNFLNIEPFYKKSNLKTDYYPQKKYSKKALRNLEKSIN